MYKKNKHIHFVGIGGIGMSGIAELLLNLGYTVSGSDLRESPITKRLAGLGGQVHIGHRAEWIKGADVVVISTAVKGDNPEVLAAVQAQIPIVRRAEMLAELMRLKRFGIAVAGSHGKTTTTSMVGWVLAQAGLDPTVVIGGQVNSLGGSNAKLGQGEFLVAEADESDGSFLHLSPVVEVVTNIDLEHLDYYRDIEQIKGVFLEFIHKIPFYGAAVICLDDPEVADLVPLIKKRIITYGMSAQAQIRAREISGDGLVTRFEVCQGGEPLGRIVLPLAGIHNVYNTLAAVGVGLELDIPFPVIAQAMSTFSGVQRRLQVKGEINGITVVDDYGHHPTEIRATLSAMRAAWPKRRLVVFFQPHRYSRTHGLLREFSTAFYEADVLYVAEIYPAGEKPIEGVNAAALIESIQAYGHKQVYAVPDLEHIAALAIPALEPGDVALTLGAGNIWRAGEQILKGLRELEATA